MTIDAIAAFGTAECMYQVMRPGHRCQEQPTHRTPETGAVWCAEHAEPDDQPLNIITAPGESRQMQGRGVRS